MKIAILDDYQDVAFSFADWSQLARNAELRVFNHNLATVEEAAATLADFDILCLMRERMPVSRALIERLPKLKFIVVTGAHNRTLDLAAASDRGILVSHTRGAGTEHPTTELTWGLILAATRHLTQEERGMRDGGWQTTVGRTLHGRRLGVVGLGRLGTSVARIGQAFGMEVVAWSQNLTEARAAEVGAVLLSKEELFASSDVVSLHLALSERTRAIVGAAELAAMKDDALLVNTSRGALVDEAALIGALRARRPAMAALDVYDVEPLPPDHPLRSLDNVVLSPHLGYVAREVLQVFYGDTVENLEAFLQGKPIRLMNPIQL